jgi:hypothetical protein
VGNFNISGKKLFTKEKKLFSRVKYDNLTEIKFSTLFISFKVAQGAQEAPKIILELSLIGRQKLTFTVVRALTSKNIFFLFFRLLCSFETI